MQKIPTIFKRDFSCTHKVLDKPNPACAWVFAGEGKVYRKFQGMSALIQNGTYYKRCIIKKNQIIPASFIVCTIDSRSGKQFGWLPVSEENPQDKYYIEAFNYIQASNSSLPDGTYELIGPKIHGNPEGVDSHMLVKHTTWEIPSLKRTFKDIKHFLSQNNFEGLVFHNSDGQMAKIKKKDFGMMR